MKILFLVNKAINRFDYFFCIASMLFYLKNCRSVDLKKSLYGEIPFKHVANHPNEKKFHLKFEYYLANF